MATLAIVQGKRPERPTHPNFTEKLWSLTQRCWNGNHNVRPRISEVMEILVTPLVSRSL